MILHRFDVLRVSGGRTACNVVFRDAVKVVSCMYIYICCGGHVEYVKIITYDFKSSMSTLRKI